MRRPDPRPGGGLLEPLALLAIGILLINDHWGKRSWPGPVTGKLSDFAGLVFFPLALQAGWELGRARPASRRALAVSIALTGLVFAAVKTWPPALAGYRCALATLQWLPRALVALGSDRTLPSVGTVAAVLDPTDLVALSALALAAWIGWARCAPASRPRAAGAVAPPPTRSRSLSAGPRAG